MKRSVYNVEEQQKVNAFWSKKQSSPALTRWWNSPYIRKKINASLINVDSSEFSYGLLSLVKKYTGGRIFESGISVGVGNGSKEMQLIKHGLVKKFTLYELSEKRIEDGIKLARKNGLEDKVSFVLGDAFSLENESQTYDFVHWNNSLHHMLDTTFAVRWSRNMLIEEGVFYMDDYVGPNRFQWTETMLRVTNQIREVLPEKYFAPINNQLIERRIKKPSFLDMMRVDPSEAPDSESIIPAIKRYFPSSIIKYTGGVIYHLAMKDIIHNIEKERDYYMIDLLLIIDDLLSQMGQNHYAIAFDIK